eukprot:c14813_g1_i1.p1 GENE.c14813_g1_i1~~c14813_g1_i1.p1  ORF type:complete len:270 (+),score=38.64 c14813_g1_i1:35-811(+)
MSSPFLLRQILDAGPLPTLLQHLFSHINNINICDAFAISTHLALLEIGFSSQDSLDPITLLPQNWKSQHMYSFNYIHFSPGPTLTVFVTCLKNSAVISAVVRHAPQPPRRLQLQLQVDYFFSICRGVPRCSHMSTFSQRIKDEIGFKSLYTMCDFVSHPYDIPILSLPNEVLLIILGQLDPSSIAHFSLTCKRFAELGRDDQLWENLYRLYFETPLSMGNAKKRTRMVQHYLHFLPNQSLTASWKKKFEWNWAYQGHL